MPYIKSRPARFSKDRLLGRCIGSCEARTEEGSFLAQAFESESRIRLKVTYVDGDGAIQTTVYEDGKPTMSRVRRSNGQRLRKDGTGNVFLPQYGDAFFKARSDLLRQMPDGTKDCLPEI